MTDPLIAELIRQAADAARAGDRAGARQKLEAALEEDEENITAWLLLARVTDNIDEKRMALATVFQLDPVNVKARDMLRRLDEETNTKDEIIPGVSRRQFQLIVGGIVGLLVVVIIIIVANNNSQQASRNREIRNATAQALQATGFLITQTADAIAQTERAVNIQETQFALVSPTPSATPTSNRPTLPPTFTPEPTQMTGPPTALPLPQNVTGRIIGWRGRDLSNDNTLPLAFYEPSTGAVSPIAEALPGRDADIRNDRVVYAQPVPNSSDIRVALVNSFGLPLQSSLDQSQGQGGYIDFFMPSLDSNGSRVVFIGNSLNTRRDEIFVVTLDGSLIDPNTILQLTNGEADYRYPAFSPDGSRIIAVREDDNGIDLVIININDRSVTPLTGDGNTVRETTPRFSPDGSLVAYAAAPQENRNNNDIYLVPINNPGGTFKIIENPADDIHPVFSPDGRHLAFASDRGIAYDIFIYNLSAQALFQLTNDEEEDYPGGWIN